MNMNIFLTFLVASIISKECINGAITLSLNETQNKLHLRDLNEKSLIKKRGFFDMHSFYDNRFRSLAGELRQIQRSQKKEKLEKEMRLEQERRDQIYRQYLARQYSFHRDFHTFRY